MRAGQHLVEKAHSYGVTTPIYNSQICIHPSARPFMLYTVPDAAVSEDGQTIRGRNYGLTRPHSHLHPLKLKQRRFAVVIQLLLTFVA
jgi:hypothetical protein